MVFKPGKQASTPRIQKQSIKDWLKGTTTNFDSGRVPSGGLITSANVMLDQDGTVRPRPSLVQYGPQPIGKVIGQIFEAKLQTTTTTTYMISMQNVNGTTNIYYAKGEDSTWTKATGKTYDNAAAAHFCQIQNKVLIMNGADTLSYLDLKTMNITAYTKISAPSAPTLGTNNVTGTSFKVYYAVTANSTVGETEGSAPLTVSVGQDRSLWNPTSQNVQIKWTTVTGVKSWNVYMGTSADGAGQPTMYCIASGLDASILNFTDNGTAAQDVNRPLPTNNSTAGPRTTRGDVINSRVWMTGDVDNPFYVWRGGDYGYELDFSPANGGGFSPIGNGTVEVPIAVKSFRDGKGDQAITVLTKSTNGNGKRFLLSPQTVTYGSSTFVAWQVQEDTGTDGTDSPDGVIIYNNSLWYPSRDGFKTTGTKPQLQNVLATDRISNTIANDITRLNTKAMPNCVGIAYEGRLYWSLPVGTSTNNEIWMLDLDRDGAWMKPWNIAADWMWLYNDNSGNTHMCIISNNVIYEFSRQILTADDGNPFVTSLSSGFQYFSEDQRDHGQLLGVTITLERPQGKITAGVTAHTEDGDVNYSVDDDFSAATTFVGWSEPSTKNIKSWGQRRWGKVEDIPSTVGIANADMVIDVDEEALYWSYHIETVGTGVSYQLSNVVAQYVNIGSNDFS